MPRPLAADPVPPPRVREVRRDASHAGLHELLRLSPRPSAVAAHRLNLIVPAISPGAAFGGAATAIDAFMAMAAHSERCRIITAERLDATAHLGYPGFAQVSLDSDSDVPAQLVSIADAKGATLPVGPRDVFVATFWPTASFAIDTRLWQAATFGRVPRSFVYLIQDYEPAFYPSSAQSEMARATYSVGDATIAIFNTSILHEAFRSMSIRFAVEFSFEPRLSRQLRAARARRPVPRKRRVVVYGRPSKARNAFPFIVDGLHLWRNVYADAERWSVVSIGEPHAEIDLGGGLFIDARGQLDLPTYGRLLRNSAIGVSLMISPHPSYPPLEMAALGLLVLTNRYRDKDLSTWHTNITSVSQIRVEDFSSALAELCRRFESDPRTGERGQLLRADFTSDSPQFPFAADVVALTRRE